jgi:DNA repair protein RecO (recombination protein O)
VAELLDAFTYEEGSHVNLYRLLVNTLRRLNRGDPPGTALRYYEIRLLEQVGYRPELFSCVECGQDIQEEDQYLSGKLGGVVCPGCGQKAGEIDFLPVSSRVLKYLRHIQRSPYRHLKDMRVPPGLEGDIERAVQYYLVYILEKSINSADFIARMEQLRFRGSHSHRGAAG